MSHGGRCPKGQLAEDGPIDPRYQLQETSTGSYPQRTEWNVRDSDGTVAFSIKQTPTGGSKKTMDLALKHRKPILHLCRDIRLPSPEKLLVRFIADSAICTLNVAETRASTELSIWQRSAQSEILPMEFRR